MTRKFKFHVVEIDLYMGFETVLGEFDTEVEAHKFIDKLPQEPMYTYGTRVVYE